MMKKSARNLADIYETYQIKNLIPTEVMKPRNFWPAIYNELEVLYEIESQLGHQIKQNIRLQLELLQSSLDRATTVLDEVFIANYRFKSKQIFIWDNKITSIIFTIVTSSSTLLFSHVQTPPFHNIVPQKIKDKNFQSRSTRYCLAGVFFGGY